MESLVDRYCANPHAAAITAAAIDPETGARITADAWGTVGITPPGESWVKHIFDMDDAVQGAVAMAPGGSLAAVGDDSGTIAVYRTWDLECVFEDVKEGAMGPARAFRALAFNPQGTILAALSVDGVIRIFDIQRWDRLANFKDFAGESVAFDHRGDRLLAIDTLGQPKLIDLMSNEVIDLELVPGGVRSALFTPDSRHVIALGQAGITLIALPEARIVASFSARGSSGMLALTMHPDGSQLAAITGRSAHYFHLPELQPADSKRHGAPNPSGAVWWDAKGVVVAGDDGRLHRPGARQGLGPVHACTGFGDLRVTQHKGQAAIWQNHRQKRPFQVPHDLQECRIDREGRLMVGADPKAGLQVYEARTGRHLFDAGRDTVGSPGFAVGGSVVACLLAKGGLRWFDLKANQVYELPWVGQFALSGSGTWMAVTTPRGRVRVLDPATGKDAIPSPLPDGEPPVQCMAFINRQPTLLVINNEGLLTRYDLAPSVTHKQPAEPERVIAMNVTFSALWGITGGEYAVIRVLEEEEPDLCTMAFIELETGEVHEVADVPIEAGIDPESGHILMTARGAALLELDREGNESRLLRALPEGEWVCIEPGRATEYSSGFQP